MSRHLHQRNTTYLKHFKFAWGAGCVLLSAGLASLIHAIIPDVLTSYSERKTTALSRLAKIKNKND